MAIWGKGYITDSEYVDEFNPEQSPQNIALAATLRGFEARDMSGKFAYCELGCGKGLTSLFLAASNPNAEFHAVDFNPAYIAHAQHQAESAQLKNITYHERSIEELNGDAGSALPMFDIVAMHGVWSWISPELQSAILEFLKRRLKPGGLVYITYNVMSQWAVLTPLQRILRSLAGSSAEDSEQATRAALAMLDRLMDANVLPASYRGALQQLGASAPSEHLWAYLAHEFLPEHWKPTYHVDVAAALGEAKLTFAGSTDLLRNLANVYLTEAQSAALAEIRNPELRETLIDSTAGHWLRFDVFVRGARRISKARQDALLGKLRLALVRPAPDSIELPGPNRTMMRAHPDKYRRFTDALVRRPHSVAELLQLPAPAGHGISAAEFVSVLLGTGLASPVSEPDPAAQAACARLNQMVEAEGELPFWRRATLAVPALRSGLVLSALDFELYLALRRGEQPNAAALAMGFITRSKRDGGQPVVDGRQFSNDAAAQQSLTADFARKIERLVPLWRNIDLIGASAPARSASSAGSSAKIPLSARPPR